MELTARRRRLRIYHEQKESSKMRTSPDYKPVEVDMDTHACLTHAIAVLDQSARIDPRTMRAKRRLQEIIDQRGCEVYGAGADDGLLTHFIDIIIDG
jgi:hypothetical protein